LSFTVSGVENFHRHVVEKLCHAFTPMHVFMRESSIRNKTIKFPPTRPMPNKLRGLYSLRRNFRVAPL
jgi:hypothetical protein